ncbi:hypothetical protein [Kribbella speibonae]|uniref:Uncharacterized protein n=1 Tax=Kribbella speibonae TaxID=1572660 RepID=A0A4V2M5N6_9ACTN|nr:hypothetical protein [Kribbella speibonae]TCC40452.1 hypothetical protein E0H92_01715 [Kribbella speibonae]
MGLRKSKGRVEVAKDRVRPLAESASEKFGPAVGQVRDHLGPAVGTAREKVSPYAEKAVERGAHLAHQAVEKAGPVLDDALAKVGPATEHAAEKARERLNDDVLPKVTAALATLAAAAEPVVEETARRGKATKAALKGELDVPKKSHKLRNVVLFLGLGALAAAAVKKLLTPPEPAWQSTPTSGRDYSSAPAGTSSRPTDTPSSNGKTDAKPGADTAKTDNAKPDGPKTDGPKTDGSKAEGSKAEGSKAEGSKAEAPKAEAKPEAAKDEVKAASNGATKRTTTRKSTGSGESKPSDS